MQAVICHGPQDYRLEDHPVPEIGPGEVLVEVERQGVLHKGRVRVRGGAVGDVDVNPTYSIFP